MNKHILLDCDGVLSDFLQGAINVLNKKLDKNITTEQFVTEFGAWGINEYYGVSIEDFWTAIETEEDFWLNLKPLPWAKELYGWLSSEYEVTIVTSPSLDPDCARQKLEWLKKHLGITSDKVFIGGRKNLMAGNGVLIDDWAINVDKFREAGGKAIKIPSNWNTLGLTFTDIQARISTGLELDDLFNNIKHLYK